MVADQTETKRRRGIDSNVLVYAHVPDLAEHERVRAFLATQLADDDLVLVLTASVLDEFLHIVTDSRRFASAPTMSEALSVARAYLGHVNIECFPMDEMSIHNAFRLIEMHGLGRRRVTDALFASTLLNRKVEELITCDPDDFAVFEGLSLIDPRG